MDNQAILAHVDHTLLTPCATWEDIRTLCEEAITWKTASVCIPPSYVGRVSKAYGSDLCICTVIGFPLGYQSKESKIKEAEIALAEGAREVDMVINLGDVKNGDFDLVTAEIAVLKSTVGSYVLKVIIETCYLTKDDKMVLCQCVTDAGANYIKTSTGFGTGGALLSDVELFKLHLGKDVKIKASGGIRSKEDFEAYLAAGCDRIGTSSAVKVLCKDKMA